MSLTQNSALDDVGAFEGWAFHSLHCAISTSNIGLAAYHALGVAQHHNTRVWIRVETVTCKRLHTNIP